MTARITIVGAGINGLVAANYLARAGARVTLLEREDRVGGACISETTTVDGHRYTYPLGATVLGFMQDFVFEETGLAERLRVWAPTHPKLVYFPNATEPVFIHRDPDALARELREKCGEMSDVARFRADEARVVRFLRDGFREARAPRLGDARAVLGEELTARFITGSARDLLTHYFTSEKTRVYMAMTVIEAGPVSLDAPYSAFNVPLMDSGSVFGGYYGFVKGGIWTITEELRRLNEAIGVRVETSTSVRAIDQLDADAVALATDPVTAARICGESVPKREFLGTSGKLTMAFRRAVQWKDSPETNTAFRFVFLNDMLDGMERAAQRVVADSDFEPGYIQVYCDGAGMRHLGVDEPFERVIAFFKNVRFGKTAKELPDVERFVKNAVLARVANPDDLAWSTMLAPKDLADRFLFPEGNVDHMMMTNGQNFDGRHFSPRPDERFYQFGSRENVFYCGAGAYPCGSVAGTAGYMCAQEILRTTA